MLLYYSSIGYWHKRADERLGNPPSKVTRNF